jgi:hypothetical protein
MLWKLAALCLLAVYTTGGVPARDPGAVLTLLRPAPVPVQLLEPAAPLLLQEGVCWLLAASSLKRSQSCCRAQSRTGKHSATTSSRETMTGTPPVGRLFKSPTACRRASWEGGTLLSTPSGSGAEGLPCWSLCLNVTLCAIKPSTTSNIASSETAATAAATAAFSGWLWEASTTFEQ